MSKVHVLATYFASLTLDNLWGETLPVILVPESERPICVSLLMRYSQTTWLPIPVFDSERGTSIRLTQHDRLLGLLFTIEDRNKDAVFTYPLTQKRTFWADTSAIYFSMHTYHPTQSHHPGGTLFVDSDWRIFRSWF